MQLNRILENIQKHILLEEEEINFFISLLHVKKIKRKQYLLEQGQVCKTENFIVKGCLQMYTIDDKGLDHIIMFGIEDWWVSDLYSFLTNEPSIYYIEALEDTEVLQITKTNLDKLYAHIPKFERLFRILLQNAFIAHQQRINQNLSFTAEQRYLDFIEKNAAFEQRIPQKRIAAYLGFTPVFLSMIRKKLSKQ